MYIHERVVFYKLPNIASKHGFLLTILLKSSYKLLQSVIIMFGWNWEFGDTLKILNSCFS